MMKLHLGCGHKYLDGWVNVDGPKEDLPYDDLTADIHSRIEDLEYADESVDEILMEAAFEHFPRHIAVMQLRKMYLWLKPMGKITILVPDFWGTVRMLKKSKNARERQFWYRHLFGPQDTLEYGTHYDAFDVEKLQWMFSVVGFKQTSHEMVKQWPYIRFVGVKQLPVKNDQDAIRDIVEYMAYLETNSEEGLAFRSWMKAMGLSCDKPETPPYATHTDSGEGLTGKLKALFGRFK